VSLKKPSFQVTALLYFAKFLMQHHPFIFLLLPLCGQSENLIVSAQNAYLEVAVVEHFAGRGS
jgi:hypothetical protein